MELNPTVPEELETIAMKCLEKDPGRRYETAIDLEKELGRWLGNRPILARPVGSWGRVVRWCRRETALAGLGSAVVVLVVAFALVAGVAAVRIADARDVQEAERRRAERTVTDLRLRQAEEWVRQGKARDGLAVLARVLRDEPTNRRIDSRPHGCRRCWRSAIFRCHSRIRCVWKDRWRRPTITRPETAT